MSGAASCGAPHCLQPFLSGRQPWRKQPHSLLASMAVTLGAPSRGGTPASSRPMCSAVMLPWLQIRPSLGIDSLRVYTQCHIKSYTVGCLLALQGGEVKTHISLTTLARSIDVIRSLNSLIAGSALPFTSPCSTQNIYQNSGLFWLPEY